MTDPLGQSQVLPYLRELSKHGYQFHLLSFEKPDRFAMHKDHIRSICAEAGIIWHPQDYNQEGGLRRTLRQVKRMNSVVNYLHRKHHFDMTHCRSYISALAGLALKKKGIKMIFDMRGFWADERVDGGLWDQNKWIYKTIYNYFKRKEIAFLENADYTISLTENGRDEILSWKKLKSKPKIQIIPCCVDLELFDPEKIIPSELRELRSSLRLTDSDYILGYVGSIGTWYMLSEMLDFFSVLQTQNPTAKFLFVTAEKPELIIEQAKLKGIQQESIRITSCLHHKVPIHIALFDRSIFFIKPSYSKKASSPTKQGELMAMGIPVVCNSGVGDTDEIIRRYYSGIIVKEFSTQEYQTQLLTEPKFNKSQIEQGARQYFALEEGVKRYLRVYKEINDQENSNISTVSF